MEYLILAALGETLLMILVSGVIGVLLGVPIALFLFNHSTSGLRPSKPIYHSLELIINAIRSIPYVILIVILIPLTRILVGTSIGLYAAIVPLAISAILLIAKMVEESLKTVPHGLIEVGVSMGASNTQIMWKILIPESLPNIISGLTLVMINLVGFSAIAGTIGGGGLGDLAIRYGYQRYNLEVLVIIVLILIGLVQLIQITGNILSQQFKK